MVGQQVNAFHLLSSCKLGWLLIVFILTSDKYGWVREGIAILIYLEFDLDKKKESHRLDQNLAQNCDIEHFCASNNYSKDGRICL